MGRRGWLGPVSDITPPDVSATVESNAVSILRDKAGHEFEVDGVDMQVCEDAVEAVRASGFDGGFWYTSEDVVDDWREWYDERARDDLPGADFGVSQPIVANHGVAMAPDGVVCREMFFIGEGSVTTPMVPLPGTPIVVRAPAGVAVVSI